MHSSSLPPWIASLNSVLMLDVIRFPFAVIVAVAGGTTMSLDCLSVHVSTDGPSDVHLLMHRQMDISAGMSLVGIGVFVVSQIDQVK